MAAVDIHEVVYGSSKDTTAPTIGSYSPSSGSTITNSASVALTIADTTPGIATLTIWASWTGQDELVAVDTSGTSTFGGKYSGSSSRSGTSASYVYTLYRTGGWPKSSISVKAIACDSDGNVVATTTATYTVSNPTDNAAPVITFTPTTGSGCTATQSVQVDMTDDGGTLTSYTIIVADEVAAYYDGTTRTISTRYDAASTDTSITNGRRVTLYRDDGWATASLTVRAIVAAGDSSSTASATYTVSNPTGGAPTITGLSPADATQIGRNTPVTFNIVTPNTFRKIIVLVLQGERYDVVHDGDSFAPQYDNASTVTGTTTRAFSVVPNAYWRETPTFKVVAIDTLGQEGS